MSKALLTLTFLMFPAAAGALTLHQAFEASKEKRSEILVKRIEQSIAEQNRRLVFSSVLPTLSAVSVNQWQDQIEGTGVTGRFGEAHQHTARLTLEQPVFGGGSEYLYLKISKTNKKISDLNLKQAELNLFQTVASAYYRVLEIQQDLATLEEQKDLLQARALNLIRRAKIGRSKQSEVTAGRSQLARVDAEISEKQSEMAEARQQLRWLVGLESLSKLEDGLEISSLNFADADLESQLLKTPGLRALDMQVENAKREVKANQANYLPTVDFAGNYYLDRAGILAESKWDFNLVARWEIFSGGETSSEVQLARLELQKLEAEVHDTKLRLVSEARAQVEKLKAKMEMLEKLEHAAKLAKQSYQEQQAEFQRGLISNLEVLRAMDDYLQLKRGYDREGFRSKLDWIELQLMIGVKP